MLQCVQEGRPLLLENLPEDIDAVLDPVISKQVICRGKNLFLKIGDAEVEYNPNFRYLDTMHQILLEYHSMTIHAAGMCIKK